MNTADFYCVAYDADHYCVGCLPEGVDVNSEGVHPVFASEEMDYYPVCCNCHEKHDYVNLTADGAIYEAQAAGCEVFHHDESDADPDSCWIVDGEPLPSGWYWWPCQPGCLPDGDPSGPFDAESDAAYDALGF